MPSASKPAVVLVHGAWHSPQHYQPLTALLEEHGYEVHCPFLPTCQEPTLASSKSDMRVVEDVLSSIVSRETDNRYSRSSPAGIILLAHSYGGIPATSVVSPYTLSKRAARSLPGGVVHMIYLCAFMPLLEQSILTIAQPRLEHEPIALDTGTATSTVGDDPRPLFYHDVADPELVEKSVRLMTPFALKGTLGACTHEGWRDVDVTYVRSDDDHIVQPAWQTKMIDAVRAQGKEINIKTLPSSQSPFLSMPGRVVEIVDEVAASCA